MITPFAAVPDWPFFENQGAGIAIADIDGNGQFDVVVFVVDNPVGQNVGYFRVGRGLGADGAVDGGWSPWQKVPDWPFFENQGAGIAIADVSGDGHPDLVVLAVDNPVGQNVGYYRVGFGLGADGTIGGGWSPWQQVPDWFSWENQGADIAVADVNGDGRLELVVLMVDNPAQQNGGFYRSGAIDHTGVVAQWTPWASVPDWKFWENQGAGLAVADLDGDGVPELLVLAVDNPQAQNAGYYSVGWHLDGRGRPADGWGPWEPVPDWVYWENQGAGAALADVNGDGKPELAVLAVDNPAGQNQGYYRLLDVVTDLAEAPTRGVWRLLENDSGVLAVHAALLHTGEVLFFAGSSNNPANHAAHKYGTRVWHYPSDSLSAPDTPVDLFCCGHAFLIDGRVLAAGGTEQYDPFHGLRQSSLFDPTAGPGDPTSPTGKTGAWLHEQDMAGGRWYPTLTPLPDGRILAASGLGEDGNVNVVPEIYTDGVGWKTLPPSKPWPLYAHLYLLADGRIFYSGGQYGADNGVPPTIWDITTNATVDVPGLPEQDLRNQSASVLLPPAQDQRVMIMGGGSWDMHNEAPPTATTAIVDLTAPNPAYHPAASLHTSRMHLCAVLLPDRTVLVNGGASMEEMAAQAAFDAEIYHPQSNTWTIGATSRVPRLYHSVALLMPDGKVITAGSNPERTVEELRIEVYWPPYLFAGPRPTCTPAATEVHYGQSVTAQVPDAAAVGSACLIRVGIATHSTNVEHRLIDVPHQVSAPNEITLTMPNGATLAPPGWHLLFVVSPSGVPSPGVWLHLS
ncbi:MAG: galactose oxidase-like domain-containing protein [Pseudonocardiaceae bacterium]